MRRLLPLLALLPVVAGLTACNKSKVEGEGPVIGKSLSINKLEGIRIEGTEQVYISYADDVSGVVVEGQENIINLLEMDTANGIWTVNYKESLGKHEALKIYIAVLTLKELSLSGAGGIYVEDAIPVDQLSITNRGAGEIDGWFVGGQDINTSISGSGNVELKGYASNNNITLRGSGNLYAYTLLSEACEATLSGTGNAEINCSVSLNASLSGTGNLYYKGDPVAVATSRTGTGDVYDMN